MTNQMPVNAQNGADRRIIQELAEIRRRRARGDAPAFDRGLMYYDFSTDKVRVAPATGSAPQ